MGHIKGPWKLAAHIFVDDANLQTVCVPNGSSPEERETRARLIAAAPDLLEALKYVLAMREISCLHKATIYDDICAKCRADAAIAKAEASIE